MRDPLTLRQPCQLDVQHDAIPSGEEYCDVSKSRLRKIGLVREGDESSCKTLASPVGEYEDNVTTFSLADRYGRFERTFCRHGC